MRKIQEARKNSGVGDQHLANFHKTLNSKLTSDYLGSDLYDRDKNATNTHRISQVKGNTGHGKQTAIMTRILQ